MIYDFITNMYFTGMTHGGYDTFIKGKGAGSL